MLVGYAYPDSGKVLLRKHEETTMTTRTLMIVAMLTAGIGMSPRVAAADVEGTTYWSTAGQTCSAGRDATQGDRYSFWWNYASWYSTNVDLITFYCSVQPNDGGDSPNRLYLTALDDTGTSNSAFVKAELVGINRSTGSYGITATATTDSTSGTGVKEVYGTLSSSLDFDANFYWVRVTMDRTSSGEDARFYGVSLDYAP